MYCALVVFRTLLVMGSTSTNVTIRDKSKELQAYSESTFLLQRLPLLQIMSF